MHDASDMELLRDYDRQGSEAAFAVLVQRHINLVYSVALRHVGIAAHAEEITQAVFIILARKSAGLRADTILEGWLHETTRLTALSFLRGERRRQFREQEAYMQSTLQENHDAVTWNQLAPLLDEAVARLGKKDRDAVMLRFFKDKNLREVAAALNVNEAAAQRRVHRAVEKLRGFFTKRGVALSSVAITGAISANSVQAAPVALAKSVTAVAIVKGAAASGSTLTLIKGALRIMAWTKAKTAIVAGVGVLLAAGTTTVVVKSVMPTSLTSNPSWANDTKYWRTDSRVLDKNPPVFILRPTRFPKGGGGVSLGGTMGDKFMVMNTGIRELFAEAYGVSANRVVLPDNLPKSRFDLMLTLPDNPREKLQQELKRRFGLTAHRQMLGTDALVLEVTNPNAPGLHVNNSATGNSSWRGGPQEITIQNQSFGGFANGLESRFGKPVINQTGLNERYDIHLQWKSLPGKSDNERFQQALHDQLGLELVPTNMPSEMLVVEKAQ